MKVRWKFLLGIAVSVAFLVYAFSQVDYVEVIRAFSGAAYIWTVPMMVSVLITMAIRAGRWRLLLRPIRSLTASTLFGPVMIGFMANNLLPARIGEIVRAVSLSRKHQLSRSSVFATVIAERVFDSLGLLFIFWLTFFAIDYPRELRNAGFAVFIFTCAIIVFLYLLKAKTDTGVKLVCIPIGKFSNGLADKAESILRQFAKGLTFLTAPGSMLIIFLYSIFLWAFTAISGYMIFIAFNLHPSIWAAFILLFVTVLAVSLPSSPGYIGTFHAACIIAFNLISSLGMFKNEVSNSVALSYSVVLWSCQFFPVTLVGLYYLRKEHFKLRDIDEE
jgi:uncharacterized protein (TIRG00374 family)